MAKKSKMLKATRYDGETKGKELKAKIVPKTKAKRYEVIISGYNWNEEPETHIFYSKENIEKVKIEAINNFPSYYPIKVHKISEINYPDEIISLDNYKKISKRAKDDSDWKIYFASGGYESDIRILTTFLENYEKKPNKYTAININRWHNNLTNQINDLEKLGFKTNEKDYKHLLVKSEKIISKHQKK